jgi:hypothetical protein
VNKAKQKARKHQSNGHFRINARTAIVVTIRIPDNLAQPTEIKHPINTAKNMIVRQKLAKRASHKKLKLVSLFTAKHESLSEVIAPKE